MRNTYLFGSVGLAIVFVVTAYVFAQSTYDSASVLLDGPAFAESYAQTSGAVLLDVRTPTEYSAGHIPGATILDYEDASFVNAVAQLPKDKTYFVYCRSGNRSSHAVQIMRNAGIASIYELRGGVSTWTTLLGSAY